MFKGAHFSKEAILCFAKRSVILQGRNGLDIDGAETTLGSGAFRFWEKIRPDHSIQLKQTDLGTGVLTPFKLPVSSMTDDPVVGETEFELGTVPTT